MKKLCQASASSSSSISSSNDRIYTFVQNGGENGIPKSGAEIHPEMIDKDNNCDDIDIVGEEEPINDNGGEEETREAHMDGYSDRI